MGGQNEKCDVTSVLTSYAITSHHQHSAWPFSAADFAPILCSLSLSSSCRIEWNVLGTSFSVVFYDFEYVSFCLFGIIFISFVSRWIYEWAKWRNANTHIPKEPFVGLNFHIKSHQNLPPFSTWVECVLHNACYVLKWFAFRSFIFTRVAVSSLEKKCVRKFADATFSPPRNKTSKMFQIFKFFRWNIISFRISVLLLRLMLNVRFVHFTTFCCFCSFFCHLFGRILLFTGVCVNTSLM